MRCACTIQNLIPEDFILVIVSGGQSRWPFLVILKQDMTEVGILIIFLGLFAGKLWSSMARYARKVYRAVYHLEEQTPTVKINDACVNLLKRPSRHPY